jgi:hypothetical protein
LRVHTGYFQSSQGSSMAPLDVGRRMRLTDPEQFHAMVKMHLR